MKDAIVDLSRGVAPRESFTAVSLTVRVRLPINLADSEWLPRARQLEDKLREAIGEAMGQVMEDAEFPPGYAPDYEDWEVVD